MGRATVGSLLFLYFLLILLILFVALFDILVKFPCDSSQGIVAHAVVGERETPPRAVKERRADLVLEFGDPAAQSRLREVELLRRPRDVSGAAHRKKCLQNAKIHFSSAPNPDGGEEKRLPNDILKHFAVRRRLRRRSKIPAGGPKARLRAGSASSPP